MIEKEVARVYVKVSTRWLVNRMHSFGGFQATTISLARLLQALLFEKKSLVVSLLSSFNIMHKLQGIKIFKM